MCGVIGCDAGAASSRRRQHDGMSDDTARSIPGEAGGGDSAAEAGAGSGHAPGHAPMASTARSHSGSRNAIAPLGYAQKTRDCVR